MAGQARATGKLTTEDENENADDLLLLRRNLQLTRARLSLQASALSEAEKTIDLLTEGLSAAEKNLRRGGRWVIRD